MNDRMSDSKIFSRRAYARIQDDTGKIFLAENVFDQVHIEKTQRKKIQILVSGLEKKGIANNENSPLFRQAKKFFDHHGFSFGITISLVKNIPRDSGFEEEISQKKILADALEFFLGKKSPALVSSKNSENLENSEKNTGLVILFPQIKIQKSWLQKVVEVKFQNNVFLLPLPLGEQGEFAKQRDDSLGQGWGEGAKRENNPESFFQNWAKNTFYDVQKVMNFLEDFFQKKTPVGAYTIRPQKKNSEYLAFGIIGTGPSIFVKQNSEKNPEKTLDTSSLQKILQKKFPYIQVVLTDFTCHPSQ